MRISPLWPLLLAAAACSRPAAIRPVATVEVQRRTPSPPGRTSPPRAPALPPRAPEHAPSPRFEAAFVALDDGRVLIAGGSVDGLHQTSRADADLFDPRTGRWAPAAAMRSARQMFSLTLLADGRALAAGGRATPRSGPVLDAEIYDPARDAWRPAGRLNQGRHYHRAALLRDGRVLIAGGAAGGDRNLDSCEVFDPATGSWRPTGPMLRPRAGFVLETLPDGRVLAAGGSQDGGTTLADSEIYDPATGLWTAVPSMANPRYAPGAARLPDGRILVTGGAAGADRQLDAEIFDPRGLRWRPAAPMSRARYLHALALHRGEAYAVGGSGPMGMEYSDTEIYDPARDAWRPGPGLRGRTSHAWALGTEAGLLVVSALVERSPLDEPYLLGAPHRRRPAAPVSAAPRERRALPPPARPARPPRPDDFAVVVGVERYKSLPAADFAENDAARFADALHSLGVPEENIVTLTGERASLAGLTKYAEEWLSRRATRASRVWFFYSGHGAPDVKDGAPYLMPWDADAAFVKSTGFPLKRLYDALAGLPAREVVAVLDACFTGTGERSVVAPGLRPLVAVRAPGAPARLTVLSASSPEEAAGSLPSAGHGMFTHFLLEGLAGAADADGDGHATVAEVHGYARRKVIVEARKLDREQTPTLSAPDPKLRLW